jgi:GTP-binding protein LepA
MRDGSIIMVENPAKLPDAEDGGNPRAHHHHQHSCRRNISARDHAVRIQKRGQQVNMAYHGRQVQLTYDCRWPKW